MIVIRQREHGLRVTGLGGWGLFSGGLRPGVGGRLTHSALGDSIAIAPATASFPHPFTAYVRGMNIYFTKGLIETFEPKIGGVPISGNAAAGIAPPGLGIDAGVADANSESWACVSVVPNAQGQADSTSLITIVHVGAIPLSNYPGPALCPVAQIVWKQGRPYQVFQILYFNCHFQRVVLAANEGPPRDLFF